MPPKAKLTEEEKLKQFQVWQESNEYKAIEELRAERDKIEFIDLGSKDLCGSYQGFLSKLYMALGDLKVPKKAKCKFQITMIT